MSYICVKPSCSGAGHTHPYTRVKMAGGMFDRCTADYGLVALPTPVPVGAGSWVNDDDKDGGAGDDANKRSNNTCASLLPCGGGAKEKEREQVDGDAGGDDDDDDIRGMDITLEAAFDPFAAPARGGGAAASCTVELTLGGACAPGSASAAAARVTHYVVREHSSVGAAVQILTPGSLKAPCFQNLTLRVRTLLST